MDIERGFRQFQDFGLFGGLTIAITALGTVLVTLFKGTDYGGVVRAGSIMCVVLCVLGVGAAVCSRAPAPWMKPRSVKGRVVAALLVGMLSVGCIVILLVV